MGAFGLAYSDTGPWWDLFTFGWFLQMLSLAIFGVAALKLKLLPRWNGLPLLAGLWLPVMVLFSMGFEINHRTSLGNG